MGEKRKLFLSVGLQLINAKGLIETKHHHLANRTVITVTGKNHQYRLNLIDSVMKTRCLCVLKISPHKIFINHNREKNSNFTMEKLNRQHKNKQSKSTSPVKGKMTSCVS